MNNSNNLEQPGSMQRKPKSIISSNMHKAIQDNFYEALQEVKL